MGREKEEKEEKAEMGKRGGGSAECEDAKKSQQMVSHDC